MNCLPSTDVIVNNKLVGVIVFNGEKEFNTYVNGFVEKPRINFDKTSWENKIITFKDFVR